MDAHTDGDAFLEAQDDGDAFLQHAVDEDDATALLQLAEQVAKALISSSTRDHSADAA